jgi:hypothetical protein
MMTTEGRYLEGDYRVDWTATGSDTVGCSHGADLRDDHNGLTEILLSQQVHGTGSGTTNVYGLAPGVYHIDASSGCDAWSFTFTPRVATTDPDGKRLAFARYPTDPEVVAARREDDR